MDFKKDDIEAKNLLKESALVAKFYFSKINFEDNGIETIFSIVEPLSMNIKELTNEISEVLLNDNEENLSKINPFKDIFRISVCFKDNQPRLIFQTQDINYSDEAKELIKELLSTMTDSLADNVIDKILGKRAMDGKFSI